MSEVQRRRGVIGVLVAGLALVGALLPATASAAPAVVPSALGPQSAVLSTATHPVLRVGSRGARVREVQTRLRWAGVTTRAVTGVYTASTAAAVRVFQERQRISRTGTVGPITWRRLQAATWRRGVLPAICRTTPRIICVDKTLKLLRDVSYGRTVQSIGVRFGAPSTPTREGRFRVYKKKRLAISNLPAARGARMPYSLFFSGGQAVHYSYAFAAEGYAGGSHGCVNVRSMAAARALYDRTPVGRQVYVYR